MAAASHDIPEPDREALRRFGLTTGLIVAFLFGLLFPWLLGRAMPWWPWALCAVLMLGAWLAPARLRLVYRGWMRFGLVMSRVTTPLLLGLTFYLVITPIAALRRRLGGDPLGRALDPAARSYRVSRTARDAQTMEKPY